MDGGGDFGAGGDAELARMLDTWTLAVLGEMDGSLDHAVHIVEIGSGKRQPVIHLDRKPRAPKRWSAEFLIADLARSAIARDGPCAACRTPGSGLSGVDGDARQGHPFAGAAAGGSTTWARAVHA